MRGQYLKRMSRVDMFGKAMTGVLFVLLITTIVPVQPDLVMEFLTYRNNAAFVALFIFITLVVGFTIGLWIDTLGGWFESTTYRIGIVLRYLLVKIGVPKSEYWEKEQDEPEQLNSLIDVLSLEIKDYLWQIYVRFKFLFMGHRQIFFNRLKWNLAISSPQSEELVFSYIRQYNGYTERLPNEAPALPDQRANPQYIKIPDGVYTFTTGYLDSNENQQPVRHKSLYTFCRNSGIVFMMFFVIYGALSLSSTFDIRILNEGADSLIAQIANGYLWVFALSFMIISMFFLFASSEYKHHYIDYLMTKFVQISAEEDIEPSASTFIQPHSNF